MRKYTASGKLRLSARRKRCTGKNLKEWRMKMKAILGEPSTSHAHSNEGCSSPTHDNFSHEPLDPDNSSQRTSSSHLHSPLPFSENPGNEELKTSEDETLVVDTEKEHYDEIHHGRRIFDLKFLFDQIKSLSNHGSLTSCSISDMDATQETRKGLESAFQMKCKVCGFEGKLLTNDPSSKKMDVNSAAVSAMIYTGQGFTQLEEAMSALDIPCMASSTYQRHQDRLQCVIRDLAWEKMKEAGKEEFRLAVEAGDVDVNGIPLITVVADGAWAKRSYRTNYSSLSGVACIIGYKTKKVLYMGVRNKYCCICARSADKDGVKPHTCYKNWTKSSTAMEADVIVEGFKCSVTMHGLKYARLIGDGDSSVMNRLAKTLPYSTDLVVEKIECTNHILRNYCQKLHGLVHKTSNTQGHVPLSIRKKLQIALPRLRRAVTGAIKFRSGQQQESMQRRVELLRQDLRNGPSHVFGEHRHCTELGYFCSGGNSEEENIVKDMQLCGLWQDMVSALNVLIHHAGSLILNVTSNRAELFNSLIAKFVGGKRVNFCLRGTYQSRCETAVISYNEEQQLHSVLHSSLTGRSPGFYSKVHSERKRRLKVARSRKILTYPESKRRKKDLSTTGPDEHYGLASSLMEETPEEINKRKIAFLESLRLSPEERESIQRTTIDQALNQTWKVERLKRLTASMFGSVCRMKANTSCAKKVAQILYSNFSGNKATKYGIEKEPLAIAEVQERLKIEVRPAGLFIDDEKPYLAATPDGLVGDDGLIEIKCPLSLENLTPEEGITSGKIKFCHLKDGQLSLKNFTPYMYQIQGQMHIAKRKFCIFVYGKDSKGGRDTSRIAQTSR